MHNIQKKVSTMSRQNSVKGYKSTKDTLIMRVGGHYVALTILQMEISANLSLKVLIKR